MRAPNGLIGRRLNRLVRTGSPRAVARSVERELVRRRAFTAFERAAREGRHLLAGPFLGEVGYELLYWIPYLRRLLRGQRVPPERVTVLTRGGAAVWYGGIAADGVELLDLVPPGEYLDVLLARRSRERHAKQLTIDELDRTLLARAAGRLAQPVTAVHPLLMYGELRFVWEGLAAPERVLELADYHPLELTPGSLPHDVPSDYVAVKLYFSDSLPDDANTRARASALVDALAQESDVVVLTSGVQLDEHAEWTSAGGRIYDASRWLEPRTNLDVQTRLIANARAFVSTYGGFSYLGPMLNVPTVAVRVHDEYNPVHLSVMRAAFPHARYELAPLGDEVLAGVAR